MIAHGLQMQVMGIRSVLENFSVLTGGRNGSASKLIGELQKLSKDVPREASEKQLNWIKTLTSRAELTESEACALVEAKGFADLQGGSGGSASKLITILKKRSSGSKKKGKSKKS